MQEHQTKNHGSFQYLTGSHPEVRAQLRKDSGPSEFGNKVWKTSIILLDYLKDEPFHLSQLKVLEVGCGWGVLGVFLAQEFDCEVTCSDIDPLVIPIAKLHARLNSVEIDTKVSGFADFSVDFLKDYDLVIGSEVCYSQKVAEDFCQLIERAAEAEVKRVVIGDPGRPDFRDCISFCEKYYETKIVKLPGTQNGKVTRGLEAKLRHNFFQNPDRRSYEN